MNQDHHDYLEIHPGDADAEAGQMEPGEQKYPGVSDPALYYPDKEPNQSPFPTDPETTEHGSARRTIRPDDDPQADPMTPPPPERRPEDDQPRTARVGQQPSIHREPSLAGEKAVKIERDADITPKNCPYAFAGTNLAAMRRAQLRKVFKGLGINPDPQASKQTLLKQLIALIEAGEVIVEPEPER